MRPKPKPAQEWTAQTVFDISALNQLLTVTWDGHLLSKQARDWLIERGLAQRKFGWNWLTDNGVEYCVTLKILKEGK